MKRLTPLLFLLAGCYPQHLVRRVAMTRGWDPGCTTELSWVIGLSLAVAFLIGLSIAMALRLLSHHLNRKS